ncbi:MAG: TonB-dependent receptor [Bacteroidales bacterium]|jgi:iron complex outermembrane receptor protein|nr:TonB-dependent receptor [Bacteroidales bacterium]
MKLNGTYYYLIFLMVLLFPVSGIRGQNLLKGVVIDETENRVIPYAQLHVNCLHEVFLADASGAFSIKIPKDTCSIKIQSPLYASYERVFVFSAKQREITIKIKLSPSVQILNTTTVVGSKYENNPEKSTTSILVLSPQAAETRNITTVDALLNTAGGVAVVDNEPQIRGGSGFSSGMGSRVLILLDNMPLLRPDAGRPMWNFIPMEDVEQIDVIKGASSVVFGSSALTGAVNVHTAYPRSKPKTKILMYAGLYDDPNPSGKKIYVAPWEQQHPIKWGMSFLHSRIIKKNFDFIVGGEFFQDQGYIGAEKTVAQSHDSIQKTAGKYEKRGRLNFATRYRFQKVKNLSLSINGNFMYSDNAQSFFWHDANEGRYMSYEGSLSRFKDFTFYLDPELSYTSPKGYSHFLRNRIIYSNNEETSGTQSARSKSIFNEYQFNKSLNRIGMKIVGGFMNNHAISGGAVFNGDRFSNESRELSSNNLAAYAQIEQKFLKNRNLTIEGGARWEFYYLEGDPAWENKPIFRAGINYQIPKTKTAFRASFGQGYRYPSIGEKYIALSVGDYGFYPNPDLKSEKSWNLEGGIVQPFSIFDFQGMIDFAGFWQRYDNYIEFAMGPWGQSGTIMQRMGFKYLNIGPALIQGVDFSVMGEGKISKNVKYTLYASYTFSSPESLDPNYVYYIDTNINPVREYTFNNSSSDTSRNVLKYRIEHIAKVDLAFVFYKKWTVGFSMTYYSTMKNVDKFFFEYDEENPTLTKNAYGTIAGQQFPFRGYYNYYNGKSKNGSFVCDARVSYAFEDKVTLSLIAKNIFNRSYTLRPMLVEAPRNITVQLAMQL